MKMLKSLLAIPVFIAIVSFTGVVPNTGGAVLKTKTYGVCGCENDAPAQPKVELTLHADQTFNYQNASDAGNKINLKGTWESKGNKVLLQSGANENGFHKTWKQEKNGACIVARKGLNFVRLCDMELCK